MSAVYRMDVQPAPGHPLLPGVATPYDIRTHLLPEDRDAFDTAFAAALAGARTSLDLTVLFETLEHWRRRALVQSDPADFRRVVRRAAELLSDGDIPADEPLAVTRARVGI